MAVDLQAVHRAVANTIRASLERETNVYPFPVSIPAWPSVTVYPGDPWFDPWGTFGPNGQADILLRLKVEVDADHESMAIKLADYCSVGTGNTSSVSDALMSNRTLDGVVADCVTGAVEWDPESDLGTAWIAVAIIVAKQNAEV